MGRLDEAKVANEHSIAELRTCQDQSGLANGLNQLSTIEWVSGNMGAARELQAQALAVYKGFGDESGSALVLGNIAELEFAVGNHEQAFRAGSEALEIHVRGRNAGHIAIDYVNNTAYRIALDDFTGARDTAREALRVARQSGGGQIIAVALLHFATLATLGGDPRRAAQLLGYVDARYAEVGMQREPTERWSYDTLMASLRETLSADEISTFGTEGAAWSEDRAVEEALKV
jgi:hypothetical protein